MDENLRSVILTELLGLSVGAESLFVRARPSFDHSLRKPNALGSTYQRGPSQSAVGLVSDGALLIVSLSNALKKR